MKLTPELLQSTVGCTAETATRFAPYLDAACAHYSIDSRARMAAFLAHSGHESTSFSRLAESMNYSVDGLLSKFGRHRISEADARKYGRAPGRPADQETIANLVYGGEWGAKNLGNTQPGDGWRYRARGCGITGRSNFRQMADRLRELGAPDFEAYPEALEEPRWVAWAFADWWASCGLNGLADVGEFDTITQRINGGQNGAADRHARWERAKVVLVDALPAPEQSATVDPGQPTSYSQTEWDLQNPPKEHHMAPIAADLAVGLAKSLFTAFAPLAEEKLTKELGRHTKNPEIVAQVSQAAVSAAMTLTNKTDPVEAVVTAKADPAIIQKVQAVTLDELAKLAPLLERMAKLDLEQFAAEEASREATERRAQAAKHDQDPYLTQSIVRMMLGVLVGGAVLWLALAYLKVDTGPLSGVIIGLAGMVGGKFGTRYDHRYGSSAGSANKDAVRDAVQLGRK